MRRKTKKELILEIFTEEGFVELSQQEIEFINQRLVAIYGMGGAATPAYIAKVLTEAGHKVFYHSSLQEMDEDPDSDDFTSLLSFETLSEAEKSLRLIDKQYRKFKDYGDSQAVARCREVAKNARLRTKIITANQQVSAERRMLIEELAFWLEIWLSTPDIFEDWLELRKSSHEFKERFANDENQE
ncbi:MAG: hypothetical protein JNN15_05640 [Blastocatellia bacterium]|nr:hypothetical protein [Blastocatellia bacterium]